jgi:hypothetical protein
MAINAEIKKCADERALSSLGSFLAAWANIRVARKSIKVAYVFSYAWLIAFISVSPANNNTYY